MARVLPLVMVALLLDPSRARAEVLLNGLASVLVNGGNEYRWLKVELEGSTCGDGSQYKFFIHYTGSPHLLFVFEGGGACWDYDTCSGRAGKLGAANPHGISDDYMQGMTPRYVSPLVNGADPGLPLRSRRPLVTAGWNVVYLPYCTGDVHLGSSHTTYYDPTGVEPPLSWRHVGFNNIHSAAQWVGNMFPPLDKLLVTGYSAGGTASLAAYYFVRTAIPAASGYLLNDSGPIHLAPNIFYPSRALHDQIRHVWALDVVLAQLPWPFDLEDFGSINATVAVNFPQDQIAYTGFMSDYNYSRYSYERFLRPNDRASLVATWRADQRRMVAELERYPNVSYFIPWERPINDSHCTTIVTLFGSDACTQMEKKRHWYEYLVPPFQQTWKCYGEDVSLATFVDRLVTDGTRTRILEAENGYYRSDPGMDIVAPLINAAIGP